MPKSKLGGPGGKGSTFIGRTAIMVNGRNLNPNSKTIANQALKEGVGKLYKNLVAKMGTTNFQFQVTGGDRYGTENAAYSSTDGSYIGKSGPAHLRGDAVDIRIKWNNGEIIPVSVVESVLWGTGLIFDQNAMPEIYDDRHFHLQIPLRN